MAHRIGSIARGTCTAREYRRMVTEKLLTAQRSALAMMLPRGDRLAAALAPWRSAAMRNAKRLRKRRR